MFRVLASATILAAPAVSMPASATVQARDGIVVLAGQFGTLGAKRKLDIVAPLQRLCGSGSESCSVFCSETSFGLYRVGRKALCRVIYRCPDASTRSVEAAREEPILLSCRKDSEEAQDGEVPAVVETLQPPPYVPSAPGR